VKMFDVGKTRMIGLPYGKKTIKIYVKPTSYCLMWQIAFGV